MLFFILYGIFKSEMGEGEGLWDTLMWGGMAVIFPSYKIVNIIILFDAININNGNYYILSIKKWPNDLF